MADKLDSPNFGFLSTSTTNQFKDKATLSVAAIAAPKPSPAKVYTQNLGRRRAPSLQWEAPEWDLAECGRIIDVESIVRRALRTQVDLFLKEGFEFTGPNPERSSYITKRLAQMEMATDEPFPILLSKTIASLKRTSNAFWIKVRDYNASGGRRRTIGERVIEPVAGYYLIPAESMQIKRDEYGTIRKYRQQIYGKNPKDFKPEDVIHFYFDRREGFSIGTPPVVPVKDDIRALRRIEENIELLVYQHLFPLFHYRVGTEERPATITPDGKDEVVVVQQNVAAMPSDGCWVTSERHEIKSIEAGQPPVAVDKVIEHFKHRIYIGLGVSPIDMGEAAAASRSTAQTLSRNLINSTKAYQKEFGAQFYHHVIRELLLESTFNQDTVFEIENRVYLKFKEIDQETRIAKENHNADMWLKNLITHDEWRIDSGRQPFQGEGWPTSTSKAKMVGKGDGDWDKTAYGKIERDKVILQSLDEPGTEASAAEAKSRTTANKSKSSGNGSVSNKNQPTNQHGTRSAPKLNKDIFGDSFSITIPNLDIITTQTAPLSAAYSDVKKSIIDRVRIQGVEQKVITYNLNYAFTEAANRLILLAKRAFRLGMGAAGENFWGIDTTHIDDKINDHIKRYVRKLQKEILSHIDNYTAKNSALKNEDAVFVSMIFDALQYRAKMIDNAEIMRAYNWGLLYGYRLSDVEKVVSVYHGNETCERCKQAALQYDSPSAIIYEELPPYHGYCSCTITAAKG